MFSLEHIVLVSSFSSSLFSLFSTMLRHRFLNCVQCLVSRSEKRAPDGTGDFSIVSYFRMAKCHVHFHENVIVMIDLQEQAGLKNVVFLCSSGHFVNSFGNASLSIDLQEGPFRDRSPGTAGWKCIRSRRRFFQAFVRVVAFSQVCLDFVDLHQLLN